MAAIYPPQGPQDDKRSQSLKREDREYFEFCLEFCSRILDRRPEHMEALELAANHCTELGYYVDGLVLDAALAGIRPSDPGVLYNLGCSFALNGRVDEAISALSNAVKNGYSNHHHMSADRDLETLRADQRFRDLLSLMRAGAP